MAQVLHLEGLLWAPPHGERARHPHVVGHPVVLGEVGRHELARRVRREGPVAQRLVSPSDHRLDPEGGEVGAMDPLPHLQEPVGSAPDPHSGEATVGERGAEGAGVVLRAHAGHPEVRHDRVEEQVGARDVGALVRVGTAPHEHQLPLDALRHGDLVLVAVRLGADQIRAPPRLPIAVDDRAHDAGDAVS